MHEPVHLKCIFGCRDAKDGISHYLECVNLWSIINEVFQGLVHPLPIGKVNYLEPSTNSVIVISAAFEVYHALKIGLRETVDIALACRNFDDIYKVSHKFIREKFQESYGRLNVPSTAFPVSPCSVPFSECSVVSDMTEAQRSWPSFPLQARCG